MPLLALSSGYSGVEIGVLTALSALIQMATRIFMGPAMRRLSNRTFVIAAAVLLAVSSGMVAFTAAVVPFAIAQMLQGVARAFFWTGSQTQAVRMSTSSVRGIAMLNLASAVGLLAGPLIAGVLSESSPQLALAVGTGVALFAAVPAWLLVRLPPFVPPADRKKHGRVWQRPGADAGSWAGVTAGAWRGLLGSYVPAVLEEARQSPSTIGVLVSIANGAALAGSVLVGRVHGRWVARSFAAGVLAASAGTVAVAPLSPFAWAAGLALAVSGLGAGVLQTVGPAVAADAVHPEERGDAIATSGTFRSAALFLAPLGVAGLVTMIPLTAAMVAVGTALAIPVRFTGRLRRHVYTSEPAPKR
jgi:MFS family permease